MALTGDFHRLAALRKQLQAIAKGGLQKDLLRAMASDVHAQIVAGFRQQRDPYGRKWAPRKPPPAWAIRAFGLMQANHPLLDKTGKMLNSIRSRATARGIAVTTVDYAGFHQSGTRKMVSRKIVPDPQMGIGPIWGESFNRVASTVLGRLGGI